MAHGWDAKGHVLGWCIEALVQPLVPKLWHVDSHSYVRALISVRKSLHIILLCWKKLEILSDFECSSRIRSFVCCCHFTTVLVEFPKDQHAWCIGVLLVYNSTICLWPLHGLFLVAEKCVFQCKFDLDKFVNTWHTSFFSDKKPSC